MKFYRITDEANTWWAELRTDGMENSISEKIVSIRSQEAGQLINPTDLSAEMVRLGLPNHVGIEVTEVGLLAMAEAGLFRLLKLYESAAENWVRVSSAKDFLSFTVPGQVGETVIDTEAGTVVIGVTAATVLTALIAEFEASFGAFVTVGLSTDQVSGVTENDFTNDVVYNIHSETPMDSKEYTVTVDNLSAAVLITGFVVTGQEGASVINNGASTVAIAVPYGTDVTAIEPEVAVSTGATLSPLSETAQDFSDPIVYTVTSQDLTAEKEYTATVTVLPNEETDFLTFSLAAQTGAAVVNATNHTVAITVANGTVVTALVSTFTLSPQATAAVGATAQVIAVTPNDFTNPVVYAVTAGDETTAQNWTITVTVTGA